MRRSILLGLSLGFMATTALAQQTPLQQQFDSALSSKDQLAWLKLTSSEPNQVGSPHDKFIADWELAQFRKFCT